MNSKHSWADQRREASGAAEPGAQWLGTSKLRRLENSTGTLFISVVWRYLMRICTYDQIYRLYMHNFSLIFSTCIASTAECWKDIFGSFLSASSAHPPGPVSSPFVRAMGSAGSTESLQKASMEELKQLMTELPAESQEKLKEALKKTETTSLVFWSEKVCFGSFWEMLYIC